jgi:hypothetical protein
MLTGIIDSGQKIVTNGLVLHLDAAQLRSYPTTGTTWTDLSGTGNNGTLTNGPTFSSANGGSIVFDGTNDYVGLGTPSSLNIVNNNTTINAWVNLNVFPVAGSPFTVYAKGFDGTSEQVVLRITNTSIFIGTFNNSGGTKSTTVLHAGLITTGNWVHITGQYDNDTWKIYTNGTLRASTLTNQGSYSSTAPCSIGGGWLTTQYGRFFNGRISYLEVYNTALSATEVLQNFNATKSRYGL